MPEITNQMYFKDRKSWRDWLKENHSTVDELWLVQYKKHTMKSCISYDEIVEEALCFGWIDGIVKRIDEAKYTRRLTPRRKRSVWSELNKSRVEEMIKAKLMTEAGMLKVNEARESGEWEQDRSRQKSIDMPISFKKALMSNVSAAKNFEALSPSHKKQYLAWIVSAKKEETKERRIAKIIEELFQNRKPGMK